MENEEWKEEEELPPMEWFESALEGLRPSTRKQYLSKFHEFLKWAQLTPESLKETQLRNLRSSSTTAKKRIPMKVKQFQKYRVQEHGDRVASTVLIVKALKKFFKANGMTFSMFDQILTVEDGKEATQALRSIPTIKKPELKTILENCGSIRMRAIIYTARDSGLRISDVCAITMKHIKPILDNPKLEFHTFEILPRKNRKRNGAAELCANPVIGPDSIRAIKNWIRHRATMGIESPLVFTSVKNVKAHTNHQGLAHKETVRGEPLSPSNAGVIFRQLRDKSGLRETRVSIHSLRKFHTSRLIAASVATEWINKFQGRKGEGTLGRYHKPEADELIKAYSQGYHEITLSEQPDTYNRLAELEKDLAELKDVLVITQGMIMEEKGLDTRDDLVTAFNEYVKQTLREKREKESPPDE